MGLRYSTHTHCIPVMYSMDTHCIPHSIHMFHIYTAKRQVKPSRVHTYQTLKEVKNKQAVPAPDISPPQRQAPYQWISCLAQPSRSQRKQNGLKLPLKSDTKIQKSGKLMGEVVTQCPKRFVLTHRLAWPPIVLRCLHGHQCPFKAPYKGDNQQLKKYLTMTILSTPLWTWIVLNHVPLQKKHQQRVLGMS